MLFLSLPVIFYYTYQNVFNKPLQDDEFLMSELPGEIEKITEFVPGVESEGKIESVAESFVSYTDIQLVSRQIDWSMVTSCIASETQCICYSQSAEKLVVPPISCRLAVENGWPGRRKENQGISL